MRLRALAVICVLAVAAAGAAFASSALWGGKDCYSGAVHYCINRPDMFGKLAYPEPTPYWRGTPGTRPDGLPVMIGPDGESFHNMSSIAMAAFNRSTKPFDERCTEFQMTPVGDAALRYLKENAKQVGEAIVWHYDYATQLNDSVLEAGWPSAFSQAAIVQLLMLANCKTGDAAYLDLAHRATAAFDISVIDGGLKSENPALVWFQEVPLPDRHNPFIFNAHLYAVETLLLMHRLTGEERYRTLAMQGVASIEKAILVIDTGNWNRYDLRPPSQMIVCEPTTIRRGCKWRRGLFPQEFDPGGLGIAASQTFTAAAIMPSSRPVDGEMQSFGLGDLSRFHWGSTAENYLPWHADLIESIGRHTERPSFIEAAKRWRGYHAAYRKEANANH
jgi:hypothetical protein